MRVIWTPEAQQDRVNIWDYIASDNLSAAARMDELFSDAAARLFARNNLNKEIECAVNNAAIIEADPTAEFTLSRLRRYNWQSAGRDRICVHYRSNRERRRLINA